MSAPCSPALLAASFLSLALPAQDGLRSGGVLRKDQACYDVRQYRLDIEIFPDQRSIEGSVGIRASIVAPTATVAIDLHRALTVHKVSAAAEALTFIRDGDRVSIKLGREYKVGETIDLSIAYGGEPRVAPMAPWDGGFTWSNTRDGAHWIATSCQGEGADLWWPCKDHPSDEPDTMEIRITAPDDLTCASNGTLTETNTDAARRTKTWHWSVRNPINTYCVALVLGKFEVLERTYESTDGTIVPVFFWVRERLAKRGEKALDEFLEHLRFFEETCGPYPFRNEKYGVAETPFLGMEHQTVIAYGAQFRQIAPFDYDWLHHHELSHEWWGNLVTCRDWKDMWIHEGIGTYMQALYIERKFGKTAYRRTIEQHSAEIIGRRAIAPRDSTDSKQIYFGPDGGKDNDIYYKGSVVMHTLRFALGDKVFFAALRRMAYPDPAMESVTDGTQCRHEDTDGIRRIAESVSGQKLGWFFDVYLHGSELPSLIDHREGATLELRWQAPVENFPMPVEIEIDGTIRRVEVDTDGTVVKLPSPESKVLVDPNGWLLLVRD